MKNLIFLLLITSFSFAQNPKLFFRSGFEPNTERTHLFSYFDDLIGTDESYLFNNNWEDDLESSVIEEFHLNYGGGDNNMRLAEIMTDPDFNFPANNAIQFWISEPYLQDGAIKGRVQSDIVMDPNYFQKFTYSVRLFLPNTLESLKDNSFDFGWFNLMEFWNNPSWVPTNDPYPFSISMNLKKNLNTDKLRFAVTARRLNINTNQWWLVWNDINNDFEVPLGKWLTLQVYYEVGDINSGIFKIILTPDGDSPINLFDIHNWTRHPYDPDPEGISVISPFKLYTSSELINYVNSQNGFVNVFWDDFVFCDKPGLDLHIRNSTEDFGEEPDNNTEYLWNSDDIWVRNQPDGIEEHQNPEYDPNNPNYVYIKINNKSCDFSSGNDTLKLYWAKANTSLSWPQNWDGTLFMHDDQNNQDVVMGGIIGEVQIPRLRPGEDRTLQIEWNVPNPQDYIFINPNPWHFCLLARIESSDDPMITVEGSSIVENVRNNNNIAWKNTTIIDIIPNTISTYGAAVAIGNPYNAESSFNLELVNDSNETGNAVYQEAEVSIQMDDIIYDGWVQGGSAISNINNTHDDKVKAIINNNAQLENINLDANEIGTVYLSFNFLVDELSNKNEFKYHLIQRNSITNEIIGGETFVIRKSEKQNFDADAGDDQEIMENETVTLTANYISESVIYNWFDSNGDLIYSGEDFTVSPTFSTTYKLEIIDVDGFKDYDSIEVIITPHHIESISPNPVSNLLTIDYQTLNVTSAYISIVNQNTGVSNNYIINPSISETTVDVSNYQTGIYEIFLICDGDIVDNETLIKE
ncbi:hypothetical protein [Aequorivita lipolytica]|uniref:T9SS type A sorting domain-containing protein n=1 Tax=Aequorivita lipolytica TaxID=153267 RepID=A0A5C6YNU0_9FLAO|nr:hypothetical protein [Aequorivita lipolytica]TXD69010.1 hypothetical protein ESV24_09675 [Aequorivita lipolytica]SRX52953.1 hypothetical protein AEQU2_02237 [Aequorivita lipolytica]